MRSWDITAELATIEPFSAALTDKKVIYTPYPIYALINYIRTKHAPEFSLHSKC